MPSLPATPSMPPPRKMFPPPAPPPLIPPPPCAPRIVGQNQNRRRLPSVRIQHQSALPPRALPPPPRAFVGNMDHAPNKAGSTLRCTLLARKFLIAVTNHEVGFVISRLTGCGLLAPCAVGVYDLEAFTPRACCCFATKPLAHPSQQCNKTSVTTPGCHSNSSRGAEKKTSYGTIDPLPLDVWCLVALYCGLDTVKSVKGVSRALRCAFVNDTAARLLVDRETSPFNPSANTRTGSPTQETDDHVELCQFPDAKSPLRRRTFTQEVTAEYGGFSRWADYMIYYLLADVSVVVPLNRESLRWSAEGTGAAFPRFGPFLPRLHCRFVFADLLTLAGVEVDRYQTFSTFPAPTGTATGPGPREGIAGSRANGLTSAATVAPPPRPPPRAPPSRLEAGKNFLQGVGVLWTPWETTVKERTTYTLCHKVVKAMVPTTGIKALEARDLSEMSRWHVRNRLPRQWRDDLVPL